MNKCRSCGCTDLNACWDKESNTPCFWVEPDLCSSCAGQVTEEEREIAGRLSLCYVTMQECLKENKKPILIVMQGIDEHQLSYISALEVEGTELLLRLLLDKFPTTVSTHVDAELQINKTVQVNQGPGKN